MDQYLTNILETESNECEAQDSEFDVDTEKNTQAVY